MHWLIGLALAASSAVTASAAASASNAVAFAGTPTSIQAIQDDRGLIRPGSNGSSYGADSPAYGFRYAPAPYYSLQPYRPRVVAPTRVRPPLSEGLPRPWTTRWYDYCSEKYASFDRRTGSFLTYGGSRRLCR